MAVNYIAHELWKQLQEKQRQLTELRKKLAAEEAELRNLHQRYTEAVNNGENWE